MKNKLIGQAISHYKIIEKLGEGGMGIIYKAEDIRLKRTVALKFLPQDLTREEEAKERFIQEAQAASILDHLNICNIHQIDETEDGQIFIVMTLYDGQTLKDRITEGPLKLDDAVDIAIQTAQGLAKAHKNGIIHRDIKPANIIITNDKVVKIVDFGLAKLKGRGKVTERGYVMGTVTYMSPEQVMGEESDFRTDIWSLGAVFYELITGKPAFAGKLKPAVMYAIINEEPDPLTTLCPGVPLEVERIIKKSLKKSRDERYLHITDMIVDLQKLKKDLDSGKSLKTEEIQKKHRPKRSLPRYLLICLILIMAAIGIRHLFKGKATAQKPEVDSIEAIRKKNSVVIVYYKNNSGDKNLDYLCETLTDLMINDLAQSKFFEVLSEERLRDILTRMKKLGAQSYTSDDLKEIASRGGKVYVLVGKFNKIGEEFRINITIQKAASGDIIASESVKGIGKDSLYAMIDDLTVKIKANFQLSSPQLASDIDRNIDDISTPSIKAYQYYIQGKRYTRERKFQKSNEALKKAIAIDSKFALAYRFISINYFYLGNNKEAKEFALKALSLLHRLSERDRYLIQGYIYFKLENSYKKAIKTYKELIKNYGDDEEAIISLGVVYRNSEEWDLAIEQFEKIINTQPETAATNLAYFFVAKGWHEKARDLLHRNTKYFTDKNYYHTLVACSYIYQGKSELALLEVERALKINPNNYFLINWLGHIHYLQGDVNLASKYYKQMISENHPDSISSHQGRIWLAHLLLNQGRLNTCEIEVNSGIKKAQEFKSKEKELNFILFLSYLKLRLNYWTEALASANRANKLAGELRMITKRGLGLYFLGLSHLALGEVEKAEKTAKQLQNLITTNGYPKGMRRYFLLMGRIFQHKGLLSPAIENFKKGVSLLSRQKLDIDEHALYIESLAFAQYQNKDYNNAIQNFKKIIYLTIGRLRWGDIYARSYYWLGKIYQATAMKEEAVKCYQQFLQLWKNADPGIAELKDARTQLALLRRMRGMH